MYKQKGVTSILASAVASLYIWIVFFAFSDGLFGSMILSLFVVSLYVFPIIFLFALPVSIAFEYFFSDKYKNFWTSLLWHIGFAVLPNLFVFFNRFEDGFHSLNMLFASAPVAIIFVIFDALTKRNEMKGSLNISRKLKGVAVVIPMLLSIVFYSLFLHTDYRTPVQYMIPDGYVGWIYIYYHVKEAESIPMIDGKYVVIVENDGTLSTSNRLEYGVAQDQYYYVSKNNELTPLPIETMIHAGSVGGSEDSMGEKSTYERFFVGSKAEFEAAEKQ